MFPLLEPRILSLRLAQKRNIGIGVFPYGKKILICAFGLGFVTGQQVSTRKTQLGQRVMLKQRQEVRPAGDLLELGGGFGALAGAHVDHSASKGSFDVSGLEPAS